MSCCLRRFSSRSVLSEIDKRVWWELDGAGEAATVDIDAEGASAAVADAVGENALRRDDDDKMDEAVDAARGRAGCFPARGGKRNPPSGKLRSGGTKCVAGTMDDVQIHTVLSEPARASLRDGPDGVVAVHAATRTVLVGRSPPTWTSGRKGMVSEGSDMRGVVCGDERSERMLSTPCIVGAHDDHCRRWNAGPFRLLPLSHPGFMPPALCAAAPPLSTPAPCSPLRNASPLMVQNMLFLVVGLLAEHTGLQSQ